MLAINVALVQCVSLLTILRNRWAPMGQSVSLTPLPGCASTVVRWHVLMEHKNHA